MVSNHAKGAACCLAAFLCLGLALSARADSLAGSGPGTTGADFLRIPVGARPSGMAEAFTGLADDVHALAYNPAGIAFLSRQELGMVYDAYAAGVNHGWLGYIHPMRFGTYGLSLNMLTVDSFDSYTIYDRKNGQASAMDMAFQFSYGLRITDSWSVGGSGKLISSRLNTTSAQTVAADMGTFWVPVNRLRFGASVLNLGNGLRYVSNTEPLPITARLGASWTPYDPKDYRHYLTLSLDGIETQGQNLAISGGAELWYQGTMALRLGGRNDPGEGPGYTAGVGIYFFRDENKPCEVGFDYAFVDSGALTQTHRASLVLKFGDTLREERRGTLIEWRRARDQATPLRWQEIQRKAHSATAPAAEPSRSSEQSPSDSEIILSPDYKKWIKP